MVHTTVTFEDELKKAKESQGNGDDTGDQSDDEKSAEE
jgi:hypothetical protein